MMTDHGFEDIAEKVMSKPAKASEPDLLDDVLNALCIDSSALYIFDFHEPWEIGLDNIPMSISWTVMDGTIWVHGPGNARTVLNRGDTFLLPRRSDGGSRIVATHSETGPIRAPVGAVEVFRQLHLSSPQPGIRPTHSLHARWGGQGPSARVVSMDFGFSDSELAPLIAALPELILVRAAETGNDLVDILAHLVLEGEGAQQPGFSAQLTQVAQLLLVHIVRTYALSTGSALGWLAGLGDPQIARALANIHQQPASHWSVAKLARAAGLSRSVFAARFYAQVGQTAMNYLRAWRMHLAREALAGGNISVSALSLDLGYQSEAAFRAAFRRSTGQSPSEYRRLQLRLPDSRQADQRIHIAPVR